MPASGVPSANRPVAMGVDGMVTSANPLASQAGVQVLAEGGNAFDAAVATAATLNVVEPYMSGVGGIGLALVYVASEDRVRTLNFSGRAPGLAEPDRFTVETRQHGVLAPLRGIGPDELKMASLEERLRGGKITEIIAATNVAVEGEATATYLGDETRRRFDIQISRISLGVPVGSDLTFADSATMAMAIDNRRPLV